MPRPDHLHLTLEDVLKEIDSWPDSKAKPGAFDKLTEDQRRGLCKLMRSGKKMDIICDKWRACGLSGGNPTTMRRWFKMLEKRGY